MILAIRTDKPEAELYVLNQKGEVAGEIKWQAHRELSDTIFYKLDEVFKQADAKYQSLNGLIVFAGPGSFTGLRIGVTVANTLSYGLDIPVVGAHGMDWLSEGALRLANGDNDHIIKPEYGGEANITKPVK